MPTVFISHSCKDHELAPPAGLSAADAAARAARLTFARKLRDTLHADLTQGGRFDVFLDVRGGLNPGDIWQDGLHTALRSCNGGVVLLSPESLESGWVLKEATILSWRVFLREPVVLVPVVLGVTDADLEKRGFGALQLNQIQRVRVNGTDDAAVAQAVLDIANGLARIPANALAQDQVLSRTERWIQEFAQQLREATTSGSATLTNDYLIKMCRSLDIQPEQRERFDADPHLNLAAQALLASEGQIVRFLNEAGKPQKPLREELKKTVATQWVDPVPASRLAAATGAVVAIDATEASSAREYVLRAYCNKIDQDRIVEPTDVTDGSDAEIITSIEDGLDAVFPIDDAAALTKDVQDNGPIFVILGPGSVRPSVLDAVTAKYPRITIVTAAGTSPFDRLGPWRNRAALLYPLLQPNREAAATRFRNRLLKFVG